ncbi:MAG: OmpA family protein [Deltaproteobacteria bacterium]|nr:OmpA family protein [Deltaproteobacteria bacterium]
MATGNTKESFLFSMVDMIISLLVIFILLLVVYLRSEISASDVAKSKTGEIKDFLEKKITELGLSGIHVEKLDAFNLAIIVPEEILQFETGKTELNQSAQAFLSQFVPLLLDLISIDAESIAQISVEGHTDHKLRTNVVNKFYNWDLSQARASAVMKYIFQNFKDHPWLNYFQKISLFGGRGAIECQFPEDADEQLTKKCRTVKFKIRTKSKDEIEIMKAHIGPGTAHVQ